MVKSGIVRLDFDRSETSFAAFGCIAARRKCFSGPAPRWMRHIAASRGRDGVPVTEALVLSGLSKAYDKPAVDKLQPDRSRR
jgi:hypothetical protein